MNPKIGLALGGGGARGFSHIGVLRVFEQEKIPIFQITGCSIGALIGGLYAKYQSADRVQEFFTDLFKQPVFQDLDIHVFNTMDREGPVRQFNNYLHQLKMYFSLLKTINTRSVFSEETISKIFELYPDQAIESLPIRFACIATDLISGREIVINEGSLRQAVRASSSIPGIFPPVPIDNLLLIDGAATDSIPVQIVKGQGAHYVFAVDVTKCLQNDSPLSNGLQIIYRSEDIVTYHLTQERLVGADLVMRPEVGHFSWAAINQIEEIIQAGEEAARQALPRIHEILNEAK